MTDTTQTIRRSARRFFSGTLLSRISGMLRDMSMAYAFGTQPAIAAFMIAFRFAHLLRRLLGEGALQSAFIPEFEHLRLQAEKRAFVFFRDLTVLLTGVLLFIIGIGCGILGAFLQWGDLNPGNREILTLTLLMLPSLLFICLYGLNASLLQCEKIYFTPAVAPVAFNGIWIIAVLSLRHFSVDEAMPWLSFGVVIACFCQWLLTVPQTRKMMQHTSRSSSLINPLRLVSSDIRSIIKPLFLGVLGIAASQINSAVDSVFARIADPEGPALLWYAIRLQQLPLALFGIAIAGAILPPLSRSLKANNLKDYHHFLHFALHRTWLFMLPITAAILMMGDNSVNLLYGRGDFGSQSVIGTTQCLWAYGAGLLPSALVLILAPGCFAQNNYHSPAMASLLTMILNALLNSIFILIFGWGAISVAWATSISSWVNLLFLGWSLSRSGTLLLTPQLLSQGIKIIFITLLAVWGTYELRQYMPIPFFSDSLFSSPFLNQIKVFSYEILTFFGIFILGSFLFGIIRNSESVNLSILQIK